MTGADGGGRPTVAVVGSVDPTREFNPPLENLDRAEAACRALGSELARRGYDLAVFSSKPKYVERYVVEGFADASRSAAPGTVRVHLPRHRSSEFSLPEGGAVRIEVLRDTSQEWEVSFYRTLSQCDGVLLLGGGQSTRIAGIVAMTQGVPLLPVAAFGGGARLVWVNLDKTRNDTTDDDIALLGADWDEHSAARLVVCLDTQRARSRDRRLAVQQAALRSARWAGTGLFVAALLIALALLAIVVAGSPRPAGARELSLLLAPPMLAAVAGAIVRDSFEPVPAWPSSAVRGLGAGLVSVLLYVASQLLAIPDMLDRLDVRRLLFFVITIGFSSGFAFDLVYARLRADRSVDALVPPAGPPTEGSNNPAGGA